MLKKVISKAGFPVFLVVLSALYLFGLLFFINAISSNRGHPHSPNTTVTISVCENGNVRRVHTTSRGGNVHIRQVNNAVYLNGERIFPNNYIGVDYEND